MHNIKLCIHNLMQYQEYEKFIFLDTAMLFLSNAAIIFLNGHLKFIREADVFIVLRCKKSRKHFDPFYTIVPKFLVPLKILSIARLYLLDLYGLDKLYQITDFYWQN